MKRTASTASRQNPHWVDLRDSMDFLCLLRACALIRQLQPGESLVMLTNDAGFLLDLRRIHRECFFECADDCGHVVCIRKEGIPL